MNAKPRDSCPGIETHDECATEFSACEHEQGRVRPCAIGLFDDARSWLSDRFDPRAKLRDRVAFAKLLRKDPCVSIVVPVGDQIDSGLGCIDDVLFRFAVEVGHSDSTDLGSLRVVNGELNFQAAVFALDPKSSRRRPLETPKRCPPRSRLQGVRPSHHEGSFGRVGPLRRVNAHASRTRTLGSTGACGSATVEVLG